MHRFLFLTLFFIAFPISTNAEETSQSAKPSFDCNKAQAKTEKAICSSSELSAQDILLNKVYKQASSNSYGDDLERLWNDQFNFLTERNKCLNDAPCIKEATAARIQELQDLALSALTNPNYEMADWYDNEFANCPNQSTISISLCLSEISKMWDERLKTVYQKAMKHGSLTKEQKKLLKETQSIWVKYRDSNCEFYYAGEGSISTIKAAECHRVMTAQRTLEIARMTRK